MRGFRFTGSSYRGWLMVAAGVAAFAGIPGRHRGGQAAADEPPPVAGLSGPQLIELLGRRVSRVQAFRELLRRSGDEDADDVDSAEVIPCPQPDGKPLFIVLRRWVYRSKPESPADERFRGFRVDDPRSLFGEAMVRERPLPPHGPFDRRDDLVIHLFDAEGKEIERPFEGNNMLWGDVIADIDGDGFVERTQTECNVEIRQLTGVEHAEVLRVERVGIDCRPTLMLLYNFGPQDDWDYRFADRDADGRWEIELGPVTAEGIKPKAIFRWDPARQAYVGPEGGEAAHVRVLVPPEVAKREYFQQFTRIEPFAADPDAVGEEERRQVVRATAPDEKPVPPPPKPYRSGSLQGLTDRELDEFMGSGRSTSDFFRDAEEDREKSFPTELPEGFWTLEPRAAALAFADMNRTAAHRERQILAIDDRDGAKPPAVCTVYYSLRPGGCYGRRIPRKFFLRVDPAESFFARSSAAESVEWRYGGGFGSGADYDLRVVKLPYEQARRISDVLWYLRRLRSRDVECEGLHGGSMSTADGRAYLRLAAGEAEVISVEGTRWPGSVSERWNGAYGPDELINLAAHLLTGVLPRTLGEAWSEQEPDHGPEQEAAQRLREPVGLLLERFSPAQSLLAFSMLEDAVTTAGAVAIKECRPQLEQLAEALPEPAEPVRTLRQATKEWREATGNAKYDSELFEEVQRLEHGAVPEAAREGLRQAVGVALRQLDIANDPDALLERVRSESDDWEWAMGRLAGIDKEKFVAALLHWKGRTDAKIVCRVFDALDRTDPEAAAILARHVGQGERKELAVRSATPVEKALALPDEKARIAALIQVLLDPQIGSYERQKAVGALVPREDPLRFADPRIDEALVKLLDPELVKRQLNAEMQAEACRGLALRGRTAEWEKLVRLFDDPHVHLHDGTLESLVVLAQQGGPEFRKKLLDTLAPHLRRTNRSLRDVLLAIYVLDGRELAAELERIATAGPDDYATYDFAVSHSSDGSIRPVEGRCHLPRKILALWNEELAPTKAKLLVAFGQERRHEFADHEFAELVRETIERQLEETAAGIQQQGRDDYARDVLRFVDWSENHFLGIDRDPGDQARKLWSFARKAFAP